MRFDQPARILCTGELDIRFGPRSRLHIEPWATGLGIHVVCAQGCRRAYLPHLILLATDGDESLNPAVRTFIRGIPASIRDAVTPFQGYGQLALLYWAAQGKDGRELLLSNPRLLWLVAVGLYEGIINHAEIPLLFQSRQRIILSRLLASTASDAQLKLLRKVCLGRACLEEARILLAVLPNRPLVALLRHQASVPIALMEVLNQFPRLAAEAMLPLLTSWTKTISFGALCFEGPFPDSSLIQVLHFCEDLIRTIEAPEIERTAAAIAKCRTLAHMSSLHDGRIREFSASVDRVGSPDVFPTPPLPDDPHIRAIRRPTDLAAESREMSHCVSNYTEAAHQGECCIYRVLAPQRGTLEIRRLSDQRLVICQFKLAYNGTPSAESWARVRAWFDSRGGCTAKRQQKPDR